ncbi:MAG: DUF975 family protein [Patescibacteria group bacterium]
MNPKKDFSISEALAFGWDVTQKNFFLILSLLVVAFLGPSLVSKLAGLVRDTFPIFALLLDLGGWVLGVILQIGLVNVSLKFADGKKPRMADLFSTYPMFFNYLLASIIYGLIVLAGTILLIVPGVVWAIQFWPYVYVLVGKKVGVLESLDRSSKMTAGVKGQLFLFLLALLGINLLGALALAVGLLVSIPVTMVASAWVYRRLSDRL